MFGKLSPEQRRRLQALLIESDLIATYRKRVQFLEDAGLGRLMHSLPMEEEGEIFAGALVRAAERLGKPPEMGEFATVLLAVALRENVRGNEDAVVALTVMIAVYVPEHGTTYPFDTPVDASAQTAKELRILFLAANPSQTGKLSLQEEFERIQQALNAKQQADPTLNVKLILRENVKDETIIDEIATVNPHILHFAGHGDLIRAGGAPTTQRGQWRGLYLLGEEGREAEPLADDAKPSGIVLETEQSRAKILPDRVLVNIFSDPAIHNNIHLVLLNACWARGQAERLIRDAAVPFAIGMKQPINDRAAVRFAEGFYKSLFLRNSMQSAFDSGRNQMLAVVGEGHDDIPTLHVRPGIIAANYSIFDML